MLLEDKVAIVTGGGGGIGRSISETFAEYGARVVVAERDDERARETVAEIEARGGRAIACVVDVQERTEVAAMTRAALEVFGQIDVLVNNVGDFLRIGGPFLESTEEQWDALYRVNLHHVFLCTQEVAPHMIERGTGGSIVNVSSIEAFRAVPGCAVYGTFKHAVTGFTRAMAVELGPHGIRVNAIAPESTETIQVRTNALIRGREDLVPYWSPLGRFGVPDDTAGCALFLASDLSAWTTGSTVHVDGGVLAAAGFFRIPGSQRWTNTPRFEGPEALTCGHWSGDEVGGSMSTATRRRVFDLDHFGAPVGVGGFGSGSVLPGHQESCYRYPRGVHARGAVQRVEHARDR